MHALRVTKRNSQQTRPRLRLIRVQPRALSWRPTRAGSPKNTRSTIPDRYADDVEKSSPAAKTPRRQPHRPICVCAEILEVTSAPQPGELAVDATLGHGGHALEILRALQPGGRLFALDVDPLELPRAEARLRATGIPPEALIVRRTNFAALPQFLAGENVAAVDIVLADLGVSAMQIDNPERGFSFNHDGPLDLRMNPRRGLPASAMLATAAESELAATFADNADEPHAQLLAAAIVHARAQKLHRHHPGSRARPRHSSGARRRATLGG